MSLFHRAGDFAPIFRLLDDYDVHRSTRGSHSISNFSPRFDVRETKDAYLLDGEVPGINQQDVDIEFSDSQTLAIKGRVVREYHNNDNSDDNNSRASSPKPATVEDAPEEGQAAQAVEKTASKTDVSKSAAAPQHKFWVSERSVGEFHRTFSFPTRVDQDAVKASLRNGILSVVVPKASRQAARKITIE
ncbi:hypothetical protein PISL3812_05448 [Talaromyces islandicus]|uniref:SHSP domain-containing protein n=1 Tax=Talaromyces islandicus TaxID=28573 RepID=A0A0U1LYK3_TALIS|nr:hypothetical protein PISL3812_05448 [Talaromyces islandicus]